MEAFDDHYPRPRRGCRLEHVQSWLKALILHMQPEHLRLITSLEEAMRLR
ncbi:MAG: hypothetical protein QW587_07695 [Candidatus Bathyarchaeia archaeon]